jgi:hypothetical protein
LRLRKLELFDPVAREQHRLHLASTLNKSGKLIPLKQHPWQKLETDSEEQKSVKRRTQ